MLPCVAAGTRMAIGLLCTFLLLSLSRVESTELTLELQERDKQCFYEVIEKDTKFTLDFQVSVELEMTIVRRCHRSWSLQYGCCC